MQTKLAVPIAAGDLEQAKQQIKAARAAGAEMVELRTDYLENLSVDLVKSLIAEAKSTTSRELAIIVTCRDKQQGGTKEYPQKLRLDVLSSAVKAGAEFIDFEYENSLPIENREKIELALSQSSIVEGGQDEFDRFMKNVLNRRWLNFCGFSVTIPHKRNALNYVSENQGFVEAIAEKIGAANTVLIGPDGKLGAYNTDYTGALDAIISAMGISKGDLKAVPVTVIGAGGAARAIVAGLSDAGARITIYNRTVEKAESLAKKFNCDFAPLNDLPKLSAKLVINSTSIGMHPDTNGTPLLKKCIKKDMMVFDTVYNPAETLLLKQAKEAGAKTVGGVEMFVNQALAQFRLFTGQEANAKLVRKTICEDLNQESARV